MIIIFKLLWTYAYTSNGYHKSILINIILTCSYIVVHVIIFEYKCMHVVFEYKYMHLSTHRNIFGGMPKTVDFHLYVHARLCAGIRYIYTVPAARGLTKNPANTRFIQQTLSFIQRYLLEFY